MFGLGCDRIEAFLEGQTQKLVAKERRGKTKELIIVQPKRAASRNQRGRRSGPMSPGSEKINSLTKRRKKKPPGN